MHLSEPLVELIKPAGQGPHGLKSVPDLKYMRAHGVQFELAMAPVRLILFGYSYPGGQGMH